MIPGDDELAELLGHALDDDAPASPPPDRIAALRARAAMARAQGTAQQAPGSIAPTWPPPRLVAPQPVDPQRRLHERSARWLAAAAVVIAVAAGVGVGQFLDRDQDSVAGEVEYDGPMTGADDQQADAALIVTATGSGRIVDLRTDVLPILPTGEFYQVWFVGPGDSPATPERISAGTFHPDPDGRSDVRFTAAVNPQLYPIVEVTAEPGDGNPAATGPAVLRAEIPTQS